MNTTVNFEISKLVKKKGYDNVTDLIYMTNHTKEVLFENINGLKHSDGNNPFCSAPTIAEVVMWIYEKYGVWISVDMIFVENQTYFYYIITESKDDVIDIQSEKYDTATEAYSSAIEYTLKNLI